MMQIKTITNNEEIIGGAIIKQIYHLIFMLFLKDREQIADHALLLLSNLSLLL